MHRPQTFDVTGTITLFEILGGTEHALYGTNRERDAGVRTHVTLAGIQSLSQRIARELPSSRRLAEYRVIAQLVAYGGFDL